MSASNPPPADERPVLSERDASFHVATAGVAAREAAAAAGAPPHAIRALAQAARLQDLPPIAPRGSRKLCGHVMRPDDLLVSLCFMLYLRVFGADPRNVLAGVQEIKNTEGQVFSVQTAGTSPEQMAAIAALAFIYCQPEEAWDLLDRAADPDASDDVREGWKRDFRRLALDFAGPFTAAEIETVGAHVIDLARLAAGHDSAEDDPGNVQTPMAP